MFCETLCFNQPLDSWNTSNLTDMRYIVGETYSFEYLDSLDNWDISKLTHLESLKFCDADWE